jgi:Flp pilus assembly pilin Flp
VAPGLQARPATTQETNAMRPLKSQRGTSFIEYALLCAIIVGGCALVLVNLQGSITTRLNTVADSLK